MKKLLPLFLVLLSGCASKTTEMNRLHIGMTKDEVISKLGEPDDVSAKTNEELLFYFMERPRQGKITYDHFVLLVNGRVQSYGSKGDFGTAEQLKQRLELDVNQKVTAETETNK